MYRNIAGFGVTKGKLSLEMMRDAIDRTKRRQAVPDARASLEDFNWDGIAEATIRAFPSIQRAYQMHQLQYARIAS